MWLVHFLGLFFFYHKWSVLFISSENYSDNNLRTWDLILSILLYNINWKYGHEGFCFILSMSSLRLFSKYSCDLWSTSVKKAICCEMLKCSVLTFVLRHKAFSKVSHSRLASEDHLAFILYFCISLWLCHWTNARASPDAHYHYQGTLHPS